MSAVDDHEYLSTPEERAETTAADRQEAAARLAALDEAARTRLDTLADTVRRIEDETLAAHLSPTLRMGYQLGALLANASAVLAEFGLYEETP